MAHKHHGPYRVQTAPLPQAVGDLESRLREVFQDPRDKTLYLSGAGSRRRNSTPVTSQ